MKDDLLLLRKLNFDTIIIPNLGMILTDILYFHKLASSVNLYRFTHFAELPLTLEFAKLLVGTAPPIPFERHPAVSAAYSF